MYEEGIVERLKANIGDCHVLKVSIPRRRRVFVDIDKERLKEAIRFLRSEGFTHLASITGFEDDDGLNLLYHLDKEGTVFMLRIKLPLNEAAIPTITDLIPGSILYEREVRDLFGVEFKEHPNPAPLILPDEWPKNAHPLRRAWLADKVRRRLKNKGGR